MTPRLTFSLLCVENRLFRAKRIAGLPYFYRPKERKKERRKERKKREREISQLVNSFEILVADAAKT